MTKTTANTISVTVSRSALARGLDAIMPAVAVKTTMDILRHVLLTIGDGALHLTANNLTLSLETDVPAGVNGPVTSAGVAVPAQHVSSLVKLLPDGDLTLEVDPGNSIVVRWTGGRQRINGLPPDQFPTPRDYSGQGIIRASGPVLGRALRRALVSAAGERDARPILAGIHLSGDGDTLVLTSSDTIRLSLDRIPASVDLPAPVTLPAAAARILAPRLAAGDGDVTLEIGHNGMAAVLPGGVCMTALFLDGTYPNLVSRVQWETPGYALALADELIQAVRRAALVVGDYGSIRLTVGDGVVCVSGTAGGGDAADQIPAETVGVAGTEILLSSVMLLDGLGIMGTERVQIGISHSHAPIILRPDNGNDRFAYLLMHQIPKDG